MDEETQRLLDEAAQYRAASAVPYSDFQVPTSNVAPPSFASNLGGLLFGGADSGLSEYLSRDQQKAMQEQAVMNAAMSLLKNSGWSTKRIGLGEALGSAYEAGQQGYQGAQQNAIQQLLTKQKLDEAKRAQAAQEAYQKFIMGQPTEGAAITPDQALAVQGIPVGPTVDRASLIGQALPAGVIPSGGAVLTQQQRQLLAALPAEKGIPEALKLMQPPTPSEKTKLLNELGLKPTLENLRLLDKPEAEPEKIRYLNALNMPITLENLRKLDKPEATPNELQLLAAAEVPPTLDNILLIRRSAATNVNVDVGQKGFENKMGAKKTFMSEPIYKDFNDMKSAYGQVLSALDQGTPIGDVAGATKVMKLLDPGSVVRESELGLAMQASGRMDRLKNYFDMWSSGKRLTPTQRDDFKQLSTELYSAAAQAYNQKRGEYIDFGQSTGVTLDKALGPEAAIPSVVKKPAAGAPPTNIQEILNKYPPRK